METAFNTDRALTLSENSNVSPNVTLSLPEDPKRISWAAASNHRRYQFNTRFPTHDENYLDEISFQHNHVGRSHCPKLVLILL